MRVGKAVDKIDDQQTDGCFRGKHRAEALALIGIEFTGHGYPSLVDDFAVANNGAPWVGTWACSPQLVEPQNMPPAPGLAGNTLRQVVHLTLGGQGLQDFIKGAVDPANFDTLSMGMSGDFEVAIEEGATLVRVGQAIFGARSSA